MGHWCVATWYICCGLQIYCHTAAENTSPDSSITDDFETDADQAFGELYKRILRMLGIRESIFGSQPAQRKRRSPTADTAACREGNDTWNASKHSATISRGNAVMSTQSFQQMETSVCDMSRDVLSPSVDPKGLLAGDNSSNVKVHRVMPKMCSRTELSSNSSALGDSVVNIAATSAIAADHSSSFHGNEARECDSDDPDDLLLD